MHKLTLMLGIRTESMSILLRRVPGWVSAPLVACTLGFLWWAERRRPLRTPTTSPGRHVARNAAVASIGALALALVERPVVGPLSRAVGRRRGGLLGALRLPIWLEVPLAVALLDYTLYHWHVLTHRVPFLWRFHLVHHVDLDLDSSTALRFHFGELSLSVAFRAAQVALLGIAPLPLSIWQTLLFVSILFHHSNLELDARTEERLSKWVVTPRLHGIHHAASLADTDSNWSSGLIFWDRLHGTLRMGREDPRTGVPAFRAEKELTLLRLLTMPFRHQLPAFAPFPRFRSPG